MLKASINDHTFTFLHILLWDPFPFAQSYSLYMLLLYNMSFNIIILSIFKAGFEIVRIHINYQAHFI